MNIDALGNSLKLLKGFVWYSMGASKKLASYIWYDDEGFSRFSFLLDKIIFMKRVLVQIVFEGPERYLWFYLFALLLFDETICYF